jgi:hypothetical protein
LTQLAHPALSRKRGNGGMVPDIAASIAPIFFAIAGHSWIAG